MLGTLKMKRDSARPRGVTMIELLVGVAILAMLVAIAAPSMRDWMIRQRVKSVSSELVTDLQLARTESVSRNSKIVVSFDSNASTTCYTVHTGGNAFNPKCDCRLPAGTACNGLGMTEIKTTNVDTSSGVTISSNAAGGIQTYLANGLIDMTAPAMNVQVSGGDSRQLVVTTSALVRRPSICAPSGSTMTGFSPCP